MKAQTIIAGKSDWMNVDSAALAAFTGNYVYVSWSFFDDVLAGGNTYEGADRRQKEVNALYAGKNENPLLFLRMHDIAALVIYPDDNIPSPVVDRLKTELTPLYEYDDFTDGKTAAGVFVYRPELSALQQAAP